MFEMTSLIGVTALVMIIGSGVLWFRAAFAVRLPANRTKFVAVWVIAVLLALVSLTSSPGWPGGIAASLALLGGLFFLLTFAISRQIVATDAIAPGKIIPDFSAPDENEDLFEFSSLKGDPVLLKFFRGHW